MKYKSTDGSYRFRVLDKFDEPDETIRLDKMINLSRQLEKSGELEEMLWIKTTPIV